MAIYAARRGLHLPRLTVSSYCRREHLYYRCPSELGPSPRARHMLIVAFPRSLLKPKRGGGWQDGHGRWGQGCHISPGEGRGPSGGKRPSGESVPGAELGVWAEAAGTTGWGT